MNTRCKFICNSVRKYWDGWKKQFMYEAEFNVVTGGNNPENDKFFASTPTGSLKVGVMREDLFQPGKEYYLDFTEVA